MPPFSRLSFPNGYSSPDPCSINCPQYEYWSKLTCREITLRIPFTSFRDLSSTFTSVLNLFFSCMCLFAYIEERRYFFQKQNKVQVSDRLTNMCTHVIMFDSPSSTFPSSQTSLQQVRFVREAWVEACFASKAYVDETSFLIQPIQEKEVEECMQFACNYPNCRWIRGDWGIASPCGGVGVGCSAVCERHV